MTQRDATAALEIAGFVVEVVDKHVSDPENIGIVLTQEPVGGSKLLQGAVVTITVGTDETPPGP